MVTRTIERPATSIQSLTGEDWLDVVGYEGFYEVSNFGRVKALPKGGLSQPKIVSAYIRQGRPTVTLNKGPGNKPHNRRVDELVLEAHVGDRPRPTWGPKALDDNLLNVRLENLAWEAGMARATANHKRHSSPRRPIPVAPQHLIIEEDEDDAEVIEAMEADNVLVEALSEIDHEVEEWRVFRAGEAEVIVDPDGILELAKITTDGEGAEMSTDQLGLSEIPDLIRCLRAVVGADWSPTQE